MQRLLQRFPLLLLAPALAAAAGPAGLADPTRPPGAVAAPAAPVAAAPHTPRKAPSMPPRLQSVQLGRGGEATALIDGRLLRVGDALGGAKLVSIDLQGVQLQGPQGSERLWLLVAPVPPSDSPPSPPSTPAPPTVAVAGDR